jgi:transposase
MAATAEKRTAKASALLAQLKKDSQEIDRLRKAQTKLQARSDANVVKARASKLKFHEIADAAGRSLSWVQASIRRYENGSSEPAPAPARTKRADKKAEEPTPDA